MLGELCDRYGIDTISLANVIGLAFFLYQEGVLTQSHSNGQQLTWGDSEVVESLVHMTVNREGLGELLAQGSKALAERFHLGDVAAQVNDLEMPYHDPRGLSGMGLVYATSPRGACHNQSDYFLVDALGQTFEDIGINFFGRQAGAEKAFNVARHQDWRTVSNSLIICNFANVAPHKVLNLVNEVTGFDYSIGELITVGERAWNLKRLINHRLGLTRENDRLPKHLLIPLPDGGTAGYVPPFDEMINAYYKARGWDPETGRPSPERLHTLDLDEYSSATWSE
jgi:aldehyde:ferredoxin oxidoreductase